MAEIKWFPNTGFKFEIIFCLKFLFFILKIYFNQGLFGYKKPIGTNVNKEFVCLYKELSELHGAQGQEV